MTLSGRQCNQHLALALRQQFTVHADVLERVEVFRYLGRLLSQDDDDIQAVRSQLCKAHRTWARVGQVMWGMVQAWVGHFVTPLKCRYDVSD